MIRLVAAAAVALVAVAQPAPAEIPAAPVHHDLEVTLDPETREFRAVDRIRLAGLRPDRLGLAPGFVVDSLVVDGRAAPAVRVAGGWRLALDDRPALKRRSTRSCSSAFTKRTPALDAASSSSALSPTRTA